MCREPFYELIQCPIFPYLSREGFTAAYWAFGSLFIFECEGIDGVVAGVLILAKQ